MSSNAKVHSLSDLANILDATLIGDGDREIHGLSDLRRAGPADISFLSSSKYADSLAKTRAAAVVLREGDARNYSGDKLVVDDPYASYASLTAIFDVRQKRETGIHASAVVHPHAKLGDNVAIGPNCVISADVEIADGTELYPGVFVGENTRIGANCLIFANVSVYHGVHIGSDVIIHANTTIGSDGFGFAPVSGAWRKIHQLGGVIIGNRVEIGANTAIDRGALGDTIVEDDVIIDNQVHLAHNVVVGSGSAIAGCVGVAGSTEFGKGCQLGGACSVGGHLKIADNTIFSGATVVTRGNREADVFASAAPIQDVKSWRKNSVRYRQLDELFARVKKLEKDADK